MTRSPTVTLLLWAMACVHHEPPTPDTSPASSGPLAPIEEAQVRSACDAGEARPCIGLVILLAEQPSRMREAMDLAIEKAKDHEQIAQIAALLVEDNPTLARPGERARVWRTLCEVHGEVSGCEVGGMQLAQDDPETAAALWKKGCELGLDFLCAANQPTLQVTTELPGPFRRELERAGATFRMPRGFHPVPVAESHDFQTGFAILSDDGALELRYGVRDDSDLYESMGQCKDSPGCISADFMNVETSMAVVTLANVGHVTPDLVSVGSFPPLPVRMEFNANWGLVGAIRANPGFSEDGAIVTLAMLHQDPGANLYVFMILHDPQVGSARQNEAFHSLRFTRPVGLGGSRL